MNRYEVVINGHIYNFYAPNDVIALLEIFYNNWDDSLTASEAFNAYEDYKGDFLEKVYEDFKCYPTRDDVIGMIEKNVNIERIINLKSNELLFNRKRNIIEAKNNSKINRNIPPRMISKL